MTRGTSLKPRRVMAAKTASSCWSRRLV
ncbi:unnamed protein product [Spirodela intermedia]|uniref:Uncharacterized protein n=2 Tax=Spirodela intermedia TaxID=51605 RepID=A0A7I8IPJ7_SPIIN|nr:unnamed protein product [Spirodela intermedia]CAA6659869.1 unnamed protein product [Spirodela intermedia]CAA7396190.1 unnamed protein product [Spirodela intermedia]